MHINISWADYLIVVVLLLVIYYIVVGIKFYSHELSKIFPIKKRVPIRLASTQTDLQGDQLQTSQFDQALPELFSPHGKYMPSVEQTDNTFEQVQELTSQLKEVIKEAASKNYIRQEFILSLQLLIRKNQYLKGSPFVVAINNLIASECEKHGYIQLSAEERVMLWNE